MILQPYLSMDALAIAMLTPEQAQLMTDIAKDYPAIITRLEGKHLVNKEVSNKIPTQLMRLYISTLYSFIIMLQEAIYKFKASGPMLLPELIDNYWIGEIKAYEDYAILPYEVHIPQPIDKVIDMFEMNADLAILYHLEPSVHTVFGHECCAYCYPVTERMFKINCKTSADGLIHELNVTIYNSIELMSADLFEDLRLHEGRGTFRAKREHVQIMNDFNCGL